MVHRFILISILTFTFRAVIVSNAQSLYKYEISIDHLELPKKDLLVDYGTLRVKKFNRTLYTLDGYFDLLQPFTDDIWAFADIFADHGNEYHKIMDKKIEKLCTFFKDDQLVVAKVINATSLAPAIEKCPIPIGRIHFHNTHMPTERLPIEPALLEKGKVRLKMYLGEVMVSDVSLHFIMKKQNLF